MKIHIGCGSVYLTGWLNVDVPGPKTFLASDRPDLVAKFETTDEAYYARHADKTMASMTRGPLDQDYVCDVYGSYLGLPVAVGEADEILARHSFEHLSLTEARKALSAMDEVLKIGGVLRLDVPDHEETLKLFRETGSDFYIRHLLGPRRGDYGFHMMSYTRDRLRALVEEYGFRFVEEEPNIHVYPAFCLRFVKPALRGAQEYIFSESLPKDWKVLDVGPGAYPLKQAHAYADRSTKVLAAISLTEGQRTIHSDLSKGLPEIADKEFDFVWCSHVLEHVDDPLACAQTLSRVAKRGVAVMPSAIKEALFNFEETEHKWLILPNPSKAGGPPIFVRHNSKFVKALKDQEVTNIMCRMFRTGPNRAGEDQRYLRTWFAKNEPNLDVAVRWEDELKLQVIG